MKKIGKTADYSSCFGAMVSLWGGHLTENILGKTGYHTQSHAYIMESNVLKIKIL